MTETSVQRGAAATAIALAVVCIGLVAFAPTAAAQESGTYVVEQGDECIEVDPITNEDQTVEEFYDYRNPYTEPSSDAYTSFGTVDYQEDNTSQLLIYEGAEGTSVVVVHEEYHEDKSEGSNGGNAAFEFSGLPSDSDWAVMDDNYENQSDEFDDGGTTKSADWWWDRGRTDGGAIRGIGDASSFSIDATFNEDTWDGTYDGVIHDWKVVTDDDDGVERESLDMDEPVSISAGTCGEGDADDPNAELAAPDSAEVDETVTLDAGDSETGPNPSYAWFVDGEEVAGGPTYETSFSEPGSHDLGVEVTDGNGTGVAESTIEIYDGPTARFDVSPSTAESGDRIAFDGTDSGGDVASYEWDFGDGNTAEGEATTNAYEEAGSYTVELTVTDGSGTEDTTTETVEISEPTGPNASLDVPETATTDQTVMLDAGDSETGSNPSYDWFVDNEPVPAAEGPTHETSFSDPGARSVRVEVSDDEGSDSIGRSIDVEEPENDTDGTSGDSDDPDDSSGKDSSSGGSGGGSLIGDDEPTVETDNGTAVVTVGDVEAGEPVELDLTSNESIGSTIEMSAVELVPAADADDLTVQFETVDRDVPGRFTHSSGVVPMSPTDLESVTYEFAVDPPMMEAAGVTEENLTLYANDGGWSAAETETRTEGDHLVASATVDGDAPVGVGAEGPALFVTDVQSDGAVTDSTIDLVATVRNTGTEPAERNFTVTGGDEVTEVPVSLDEGEEADVEATATVGDLDEFDLRAGATRHDVLVVTATDVTVEPTSIEPGESVTVEAVLQNHAGTAGEHEAELVLADNVASVERLPMEPGEEATVTFEQRIESSGSYELSVGGEAETVDVEGDGGGPIQEATEDGAGFGALVALLAILVAVVGTRRRTP